LVLTWSYVINTLLIKLNYVNRLDKLQWNIIGHAMNIK